MATHTNLQAIRMKLAHRNLAPSLFRWQRSVAVFSDFFPLSIVFSITHVVFISCLTDSGGRASDLGGCGGRRRLWRRRCWYAALYVWMPSIIAAGEVSDVIVARVTGGNDPRP
jgi:hypothetical protein